MIATQYIHRSLMALGVACACVSGSAMAGVAGQTVNVEIRALDLAGQPTSWASGTSSTKPIAVQGTTFDMSGFNAVVSDTQMIISGFQGRNKYDTTELSSVGLFASNLSAPWTSATVDPSTSWEWFSANRLAFSPGAISVDFFDLEFDENSRLVINLTSADTPAVPEPNSYAMMTLGLGLLGAVAYRRKAVPLERVVRPA